MAVVSAALALTASLAAAGGTLTHDSDAGTSPMTGMSGASHPGWWNGARDSLMMDRGHGPDTVDEAEFLPEMIAHHEEAVVAAAELARSDRPAVRAFGKSIVSTQTAQIRQMQRWLRDWHPEQPAVTDYRPMMQDLSALRGDELDREFLEDMIGHHMVAVMMSQRLLWRGTDHQQVERLARDIRDGQRAEIVQMRQWLAQWFGTANGHGSGCGMWPGAAAAR